MQINILLQDVQQCFKSPVPYPAAKVITRLYRDNQNFILNAPVSIDHGYGTALKKNGTFKERIERFVKIIHGSHDSLKRLYAADINIVSALLFLFDIGTVDLAETERIQSEKSISGGSRVCGSTVLKIIDASVSEQVGTDLNEIITMIPMLYDRLSGNKENTSGSTEIILAASIIEMDRLAIESIKKRIEKMHANQQQ